MLTKFSAKINWTIVVVLIAVSFGGGWYLGGRQTVISGEMASLVNTATCQGTSCTPDKYLLLPTVSNAGKGQPGAVDFSPFWKTWQVLNERYVNGTAAINSTSTKKATEQDRIWGAISGMVNSLGDPYTVFMPPAEKSRFEEDIRGNFSGVGMEIGMKDGWPTVIAPLPDSPAKKAGIVSGDKVLKVGGVSTNGVPLDEVIGKIRGPAGTAVVLSVLSSKDKDPRDLRIVRAVINIPTIVMEPVVGKTAGEKIYVISLYNFSAQSASLFRNSIQTFAKSGSKKLILDLRGNPGGYLDAAVDMASWFLPAGKTVVRESSGGNNPERLYQSAGYDIFKGKNLKMVILVDQGSASASEILAGALSEYGVAKLVGEKTFGKGSVQELVPITANSSLKVTIARWLTPKGKSISQNGLDPDYVVKMPERTATSTDTTADPQMKKALELLK